MTEAKVGLEGSYVQLVSNTLIQRLPIFYSLEVSRIIYSLSQSSGDANLFKDLIQSPTGAVVTVNSDG